MTEHTINSATGEPRRYEAARAGILAAVAHGTYDLDRSPREIAERSGLGVPNVRQLAFGMIARKEITWGRDRRSGMSRLTLTEAGENRLSRSTEAC